MNTLTIQPTQSDRIAQDVAGGSVADLELGQGETLWNVRELLAERGWRVTGREGRKLSIVSRHGW